MPEFFWAGFEWNEQALRLSMFFGVLLVMLVLEAIWPRKALSQGRAGRWLTNLGFVVLSSVLLRLVFPVAAMGTAVFAQAKGYGLLNMTAWPLWLEILLAVILLDLAVYGQHVASHKIPILWRLHKVHHADRDIDATTGVRFHPGEILLSMVYKMGVVLLLGPTVFAVLIFEILLNATAMFNHANVKLPLWLDRVLRTLIVTPDMHRVHHSVVRKETDSNYGFNLSIWDKIFRTYRAQPEKGHQDMSIGLPMYQTHEPSNIIWSLLLPFKNTKEKSS